MKRICVFCGSNSGKKIEYVQAAQSLGKLLVEQEIGLVYGGAQVGLMGIIAETVLQEGGEVIGVIPEGLKKKEIAHSNLTELRVVSSMHERKALMAELADGFIALPGGIGTWEELFEICTWAQLGIHHKPCGILNVVDYYNHLIAFLDHAVREGFVKPLYRSLFLFENEPRKLLELMKIFKTPITAKWLDSKSS